MQNELKIQFYLHYRNGSLFYRAEKQSSDACYVTVCPPVANMVEFDELVKKSR